MHELSIAVTLVEIADRAAANAGLSQVTTAHLRLGQLSGVVADALLFGYDIATQGTRLEGSRLEIEEIPVVVFCSQCQTDRPLPDIQLFRCPACGGSTVVVTAGKEIELASIEGEE